MKVELKITRRSSGIKRYTFEMTDAMLEDLEEIYTPEDLFEMPNMLEYKEKQKEERKKEETEREKLLKELEDISYEKSSERKVHEEDSINVDDVMTLLNETKGYE